MALRTPPSWQQQGSHTAENDRLSQQAIFATTGIVGSSSMAVTAQGSPNMTVNIATGWAAIVGTTQSNMGVYLAYNDATYVATITTAPASNSRIDLICATVNDAFYSGSTNNVVYQVIAGTAAASPVAPTLPANSISLATVLVGTNVTTITSGNITDTRVATTTNLLSTSTYVTLTGTQTLSNKTLTAPVISTINNGGTLTLPTSTDTMVGRATVDTLTNKSLTAPILTSPIELLTVTATAATGTINYDVATQGDLYYTTAATANFTLNFRGNSTTTLNAWLANNNNEVTVAFRNTNGATPFYPTVFQIDGSAVTPKWMGGTAPTAGNASAVDVYEFNIVKTATSTYTVFASVVKFA